jgi:transposase-like protein
MTEQQLIALWHSPERAKELAQRLGIEQRQLRLAWRRLKRDRKLPPGDRPRNTSSGRIEEPVVGDQCRISGDDNEFLRLLNAEHPNRKPR